MTSLQVTECIAYIISITYINIHNKNIIPRKLLPIRYFHTIFSCYAITGDAQIINRGDVNQYGAIFKIVFETTKEYTNKRTCFGVNGTSDVKVMAQEIFPDMSNFSVR